MGNARASKVVAKRAPQSPNLLEDEHHVFYAINQDMALIVVLNVEEDLALFNYRYLESKVAKAVNVLPTSFNSGPLTLPT